LGAIAKSQVKYFNSYSNLPSNTIDVLIADEAHRIREKSTTMYMKKVDYPKESQIEELIKIAKVPVFFIDDRQNISPKEIGSSNYIRENAQRLGCDISEYNLAIQFRCQGPTRLFNG